MAKKPELAGKELYVLDCIKIALNTIGKPIPNTPMLGAFIKISQSLELEYFKKAFTKVLGKKLPQNIIDANMSAIEQAYNAVK